jgi:hypothetical protein
MNRLNSLYPPNGIISMRRPCTFKKTDVTRATKAVLAAGLNVGQVQIDKNGTIVVIPGKPEQVAGEGGGERNEWDIS